MIGSNPSPALSNEFLRLYLSVRYNTVLFPIDTSEFVFALPELGFVLSSELQNLPAGAKLSSLSGPIANKEREIRLSINTDRSFIGIHGPDPVALTSEMDSLEQFLNQRFRFDSNSSAYFYEFISDLTITTSANPLDVFSGIFKEIAKLNKLGAALDASVTNYGLRLVPEDHQPNDPDWFDIRIEPHTPLARTHYAVGIVYRKPDRTKVFAFVNKTRETFQDIVTILES